MGNFLPFLYQSTSGLWIAVAMHLLTFIEPSLTVFSLTIDCSSSVEMLE